MIWTIHASYWYTYKLCIAVLPYSSCVWQYKEPLLCSIAVWQYRVWHHEHHGIVCDCVLVNLKLLPVYQCYICTLLWVSCVCYHSCDRFCAVIPAVCNNRSTWQHTSVRCFQDKPLVDGSTEKYMLYWPSSAQPSSWAWSTSECHWWPEICWVCKHSTRDYSSALSYMTLLHCVSVLYISQTGSMLAQSPTSCFDALTTYNGRWLTGGCWPRSNSFADRPWVYSARSISRLYHRVLTVFQHLASAHLDVLVCSVCVLIHRSLIALDDILDRCQDFVTVCWLCISNYHVYTLMSWCVQCVFSSHFSKPLAIRPYIVFDVPKSDTGAW
jgi:hypothetical protein